MLQLDLNRLEREGRARIDADIGPEDPFWNETGLKAAAPLEVRLEAQQAGPDVVVRGEVAGSFRLECRRCLEAVTVAIDEDVGLLYRAGEPAEDEPEDVLPLPEREATLDLSSPVREQVLLAVPRFAVCREACRGLCPHCGTNLNESSCDCTADETDERWAPLRRLKSDA